jgi:hypothetical protein
MVAIRKRRLRSSPVNDPHSSASSGNGAKHSPTPRVRNSMTKSQSAELWAFFHHTRYPSGDDKIDLALRFSKFVQWFVSVTWLCFNTLVRAYSVINTWFNNARQKIKKTNENSPAPRSSPVSSACSASAAVSIQVSSYHLSDRPRAIKQSTRIRLELGPWGDQVSDSEIDAIEALLVMTTINTV